MQIYAYCIAEGYNGLSLSYKLIRLKDGRLGWLFCLWVNSNCGSVLIPDLNKRKKIFIEESPTKIIREFFEKDLALDLTEAE